MSEFKYIESNRVSKTQKRREAKAAKKAEQLKRVEEAERLDEHKDRDIEQKKLDRLLSERNLTIHNIEADGDCLYRAVEHQLKLATDSIELLTYQGVREKTSQYMLDHVDTFLPFLLSDQGELMSEDQYREYCMRIAKTKEWGGHLELTAIAQFTKKPVHIYQADNKLPIIIEPQEKTKKSPILLSFHKHLYHLGEHYNSLVGTDKITNQ